METSEHNAQVTSPTAGETPVVATPDDRATRRAAVFERDDEHALFERDGAAAYTADSMGDSWAVPWSDLMMVMFVLFAALVTAQAVQPEIRVEFQPRPEPRVETRDVEKDKPVDVPLPNHQPSFEPLMRINVFERSQQAVRDANLDNVEIALLEDQSVRVSVQGPMFFELGKADLRKDITDFLNGLAQVIRQTPYEVQVIGHTDDYPINTDLFPSNWELSLVRASRVARYLIEAGSIDPARFVVMGRGEYAPAVPNESDTNRALNRRVEIVITRDIRDPAGEDRS